MRPESLISCLDIGRLVRSGDRQSRSRNFYRKVGDFRALATTDLGADHPLAVAIRAAALTGDERRFSLAGSSSTRLVRNRFKSTRHFRPFVHRPRAQY